jgi:hypothetical protein
VNVCAVDLQVIHQLDHVERHVTVSRALAEAVPAHVGHDDDVVFRERLRDAVLEPRSRRATRAMDEDHRLPGRSELRIVKLHAVSGCEVVVRQRQLLTLTGDRQATNHREDDQGLAHGHSSDGGHVSLGV